MNGVRDGALRVRHARSSIHADADERPLGRTAAALPAGSDPRRVGGRARRGLGLRSTLFGTSKRTTRRDSPIRFDDGRLAGSDEQHPPEHRQGAETDADRPEGHPLDDSHQRVDGEEADGGCGPECDDRGGR